MEISNELIYNIVQDWKKKDITAEEKSKILKTILQEQKISQRTLAIRLGISHSTLHDWISMRQISKTEFRKKNEIEYLSSRLLFLLSKTETLSPKAITLLNNIKNEIEVKIKWNTTIW